MLENNTSNSQDADLGYGQLLSVLLRRWVWIVAALVVTVPIATYNSLQKDPTYRSTMQLLLESNYQESADVARLRIADNSFAQATPIEIDYATQIRVMQSSELLERAAILLQGEYPDISAPDIGRGLAVFRVTETEDEIETSILQVDYTSNNPDKTQEVLDAVKVVYLDYNLEQQQIRLENGLAFIDKQIPIARADVQDAELSLEQFRENQSLIDPEQRAFDLSESLTAIEGERRQVRANYEEAQAKYDTLQRQIARSPQAAFIASRLSESARFQNLLNQYQETELALAELGVRYTQEAPNVRTLQQQLTEQRALLQQEVERILGSRFEAGNRLFSDGQLGETDIGLIREIAQVQMTLAGLFARDQELSQSEQQIQTTLAQFPELIAEFRRLQPDIEIKRDTLQQLLRARQELSIEIARGGFNWQVVEAPQLGGKTGPSLVIDVILGGVAGLFLGIVLAFVREGIDNAIRSPEELKNLTQVPLLGSLPEIPSALSSRSHNGVSSALTSNFPAKLGLRLPWNHSGTSSFHSLEAMTQQSMRDSLDITYKNLQLLISDKKNLRTIVVTSSLPGEGKSTVTLGLALSAARLHQKVLVIDGNLRKPDLQNWLGLSGNHGLPDILKGSDSLPIRQVTFEDYSFDILPSASAVSDPVRLLSSHRMHELLHQLRQEYDFILVDSSHVTGTVDALQLASVCQNVLLVTYLNQVAQSDLIQSLSLLQQFNLMGIIVNRGKQKSSSLTRSNLSNSNNGKFLLSEPLAKTKTPFN